MYQKLKKDILGKKYSLSLAFISAQKSREINRKYRRKNKPANVLAFAYSGSEGEILLSREVIKKGARLRLSASDGQAKNLKKVYKDLVTELVIHGMLHLKGMRHGSRMEKAELKYAEKYLYRNRSGFRNNTRRSRRIFKGRKIS